MEHLDALVIDVDVLNIVQCLQHVVAGVIQHVAARMIVNPLKKHFECDAVVQIFAGVNFVAKINARLVEGIENR